MFREIGAYPPAGMFSLGHFILLFIFGGLGILFYYLTKKWTKEKMMIFFKVFSLVLLAMEIFKIIWNISVYKISHETLNRFIPLYYCSIFLYAFLILSWGKGRFGKSAMVWMTYGGIIAGVAFLMYPSSSLIFYPAFHFLSLHSIFFHVALVLIGTIIIKKEFYIPSRKDFMTFVYFSLAFMIPAFIFNKIFGTNLMFLEEPIAIYIFTRIQEFSPIVFQFVMFFAQLFLPFLFTHLIFLFFSQKTKFKVYQNEEKHEEISTSDH
jgi:uncharacterized membrane protein YwaF